MGRITFDLERCSICRVEDFMRCVVFPKYVIRALSCLNYYAYDASVFLDVIEKLRNELEKRNYEDWPEWVKTHVPKRYAKAFLNHLLWLFELR